MPEEDDSGLLDAVPQQSTVVYEGSVREPTIYVMDCGMWNMTSRHFGVCSGSYLVLGELVTCPTKRNTLSDEIRSEPIRSFFDRCCSSSGEGRLTFFASYREHARLIPYRSEERVDDIICPQDVLYLFIPDTHLGLIDGADDFAGRIATENGDGSAKQRDRINTNIRLLMAFLDKAKEQQSHKIVVVQLGDFFDIWEAEAKKFIYYSLIDGFRSVVRDRYQRSQLAAIEISRRWQESASQEWQEVLDKIDLFIPGNHDIELRWLSNTLSQCAPQIAKKLLFVDAGTCGDNLSRKRGHLKTNIANAFQDLVYQPQGEHWRAEHGHRHDNHNNTSDCCSIDEVLEKVRGKAITYGWARGERNERLESFCRDPVSRVAVAEAKDAEDGGLIADFADRYHPLASLMRSLIEGGTRDGLQESLLRELRATNEDHYTMEPESECVPELGYTQWTGNILYSTKSVGPPPVLPVRAVIHAHTHRPKLTKIALFCKK